MKAPTDLLVVPTCQRSEVDLVTTGEKADDEKDRLLESFVEWAVAVCGRLSSAGYWCDYIDPCSGLPVSDRQCAITPPAARGAAWERRPQARGPAARASSPHNCPGALPAPRPCPRPDRPLPRPPYP
jgi:hypothetical protein